ncbi:MAG: pantoate--beta-alanine ligase [Candidatus Competibacteraceae bacterium]|nr:pantoate--beta-alanine ligase [Candidatus Competibacteraceae bacterium]
MGPLTSSTAGKTIPTLVTTVAELRQLVRDWRQAGDRIALVPTMGALHAGHLSLVELARRHCERVVTSIFVNPTQFGPQEDFSRYPRPLENDMAALGKVHCDLVFNPGLEQMYPDGPEGGLCSVQVRGLSDDLEGRFRPGHFDGVATVVTKLLLQCLPDVAMFGEKDYQQLLVVRRMVRDLMIPTEILAGPTIRDENGLALSSRNQYLDAEQYQIAIQLNKILRALAERLQTGAPVDEALAEAERALLTAGFEAVDYLSLRDAETLQAMSVLDRPARLLVTARLNGVRLLDNLAVFPNKQS